VRPAPAPRQLVERQIRHDAVLRAGINDDLVGAAEQPLHGLEIHALAGDVGRLLVLVVDLEKARGRAGGLGDGLLAIGLGRLGDLRGAAARFRHHPVGVGLGLVLRPLGVGTRRLHVAEGIEHLRRRIDLLQLHLGHLDAGPVMIERPLHQILHRHLDGLARAGENRLDLGMADHLAHGAFGDRLHGAFGLLDIEQIIAGAAGLDQPEHREIDIHDVLVAGQHQAFFRYGAAGSAAARVLHRAHADIDAVDTRDFRRKRGLDRIGHVIVEAGLGVAHVFAEAQHHPELVGIDPEESGKSPHHHRDQSDQGDPLTAQTAAGQRLAQPLLATAQELLQIGRLRALAPRLPRSAVLIVPLHRISPRSTAAPCVARGLRRDFAVLGLLKDFGDSGGLRMRLVGGLHVFRLHAPELKTVKFDRLLDLGPGEMVRWMIALPDRTILAPGTMVGRKLASGRIPGECTQVCARFRREDVDLHQKMSFR
jgi:hypothetical protein